jgi:hypothetical protein
VTARFLPAYEKSVFINCPFDSDYRDLLLANVFSVFAHGFVPRTARETEGNPEPRFSRILATIAASKYSIHDLSRSGGEGDKNLARLNMPLELGMAAAFRFERENSDRPHRYWRTPDGSPSCPKAMPIKVSCPIWLASIPRGMTGPFPRSFAKFPHGSGRRTMSWTPFPRRRISSKASRLSRTNSRICGSRRLRRRPGPTFFWLLLRVFRGLNAAAGFEWPI